MSTTKSISIAILLCAMFTQNRALAQRASGINCDDTSASARTTQIILSTGINHNISETELFPGSYGGNTFYPTPNNYRDSFWIVGRLASNYLTRSSNPFVYQGAYLTPGDHPFVIAADSFVLKGHWAIFKPDSSCQGFATGARLSQWLSVYSDAGGQNASIENATGDNYAYDRCFSLCTPDSCTFNLDVLGDDLIDTVMVDNHILYVAPDPTVVGKYTCTGVIPIHQTLFLQNGRHRLRIWSHDTGGGHLGINLKGDVTANTNSLVPTKLDGPCTLKFTEPEGVGIVGAGSNVKAYPVPNNGTFYVQNTGKALLQVMDYNGRKVQEQNIVAGNNIIKLSNPVPGIYFIKIIGDKNIVVKKVIVQ